MRLTTTLDDDVHLLLKQEMARSGERMKTVVNRTLRVLLEAETKEAGRLTSAPPTDSV